MELDDQQLTAVTSNDKKVLVVAGAGSGKTRVLIERIAYLIEAKHVSPFEIMAFTFTRKAAGEIRERLETRIGTSAHKITAGTMHSIALQHLKRFGELIGWRPELITIYNEWETKFLMQEVADHIGIRKKGSWDPPKVEIEAAMNYCFQSGIPPTELVIKDFYDIFMVHLFENNALSYDALLCEWFRLIPKIKNQLGFNHILVDEVQDINSIQWRIIDRLTYEMKADLFVTGDIDQSIYSFRGAIPEKMLQIKDSFKTYKLEYNYRSRPQIISIANNLIQYNKSRIEKTMKVGFQYSADEYSRKSIVSVIKNMNSARIVDFVNFYQGDSSITILARNHALLDKISRLMEDQGVDHIYYGRKTSLVNSERFRRFNALLKLIVNPFDNFSFLLIRDLIGLSTSDYYELRESAITSGLSHFHAWHRSPKHFANPYMGLLYMNKNLNALFLILESLKHLSKGAYGQIDPWPFEIDDMIDFIKRNAPINYDNNIQSYLDWLAMFEIADEIDEDYEGHQLMTIHAAKGLEFPVVLIAGMNEEIIPSKQAIRANDADEIEAERRLAYVGYTRAMNNLILAVRPEAYKKGDLTFYQLESRFVKEGNV